MNVRTATGWILAPGRRTLRQPGLTFARDTMRHQIQTANGNDWELSLWAQRAHATVMRDVTDGTRGQGGIHRNTRLLEMRRKVYWSSKNKQYRQCSASRRGVHNPDLGLPGSDGYRLEPDQKHMIQTHEPLADFPHFGGGFTDGERPLLRFDREQRPTRDFTAARTYSHRV